MAKYSYDALTRRTVRETIGFHWEDLKQMQSLLVHLGDYCKVWHAIREAGESCLVPLTAGAGSVPPEQRERMQALWLESDYERMSSSVAA